MRPPDYWREKLEHLAWSVVPYALVGVAAVVGVAGFHSAAFVLCALALLLRWLGEVEA